MLILEEWKNQKSHLKIKGNLKNYKNINKNKQINFVKNGKIHFKEKFDIPKIYKPNIKVFPEKNLKQVNNGKEKVKINIVPKYKEKYRKEKHHFKDLKFTSYAKFNYKKNLINIPKSKDYDLLIQTKKRILAPIKENKYLLNPKNIYTDNFYKEGGLIPGSTIKKKKPKKNANLEELKENYQKYNFMSSTYEEIEQREKDWEIRKEVWDLNQWEIEKFGKLKGEDLPIE